MNVKWRPIKEETTFRTGEKVEFMGAGGVGREQEENAIGPFHFVRWKENECLLSAVNWAFQMFKYINYFSFFHVEI